MFASYFSPDWDFFGVAGWLRAVLWLCALVLAALAIYGIALLVGYLTGGGKDGK